MSILYTPMNCYLFRQQHSTPRMFPLSFGRDLPMPQKRSWTLSKPTTSRLASRIQASTLLYASYRDVLPLPCQHSGAPIQPRTFIMLNCDSSTPIDAHTNVSNFVERCSLVVSIGRQLMVRYSAKRFSKRTDFLPRIFERLLLTVRRSTRVYCNERWHDRKIKRFRIFDVQGCKDCQHRDGQGALS